MKENFKKDWADIRFSSVSQNEINTIIQGRRLSSLDNLALRYKRFSIIGLLGIFWSIFWGFSHLLPENGRWSLPICYGLYFLLCSVMDRWLYYGISSIDCVTMNVNEVMRRALFYRKRHLQFIAILLPLAIGLIGFTAYVYSFDHYFIYGIVSGAIIGVAIGLFALMRFLEDYRNILKDN